MYRITVFFLICIFLSSFQKDPQPLVKGAVAPEFVMVTSTGDTLRSVNLKGSLVYVDFWASWCLPCRKQNVSLVKLQEKYRTLARRRGLRLIFISISMDTNKELWKVAVAKDNLNPRYQVCDFGGWDSPLVKLFQLKKIPSSFLLGKEGEILEKDVWEKDLDAALDKQYKQLSN